MTSVSSDTPEWLRAHEAQRVGNPAWVKGGPSPNPSGRPKGILDKRTKVSQALMEDAPAVARVVVDAALGGDMQAASLVLSRIAPVLRGQMDKVSFDFDAAAPIARQVEQVLAAVAKGHVSSDVGKQIIDAVQALSAIRATDELEVRLSALEAKGAMS